MTDNKIKRFIEGAKLETEKYGFPTKSKTKNEGSHFLSTKAQLKIKGLIVKDLIQELEKLDQEQEIRINLTKGWRPFGTKSIELPIEPTYEQDTGKLAFYTIDVDMIFEYPEGTETLLSNPSKSEVKYVVDGELEKEIEQLQMALLVKLRERQGNWKSGDELLEQVDLMFDEILKKLKH